MWSREPKQARIHNHHISLRDRLHRHAKALEPTVNLETTKAVAWAVFQHHGGADGHRGHSNGHGQQHFMAMGRPSRFKIEAQMKHEIAHRSFTPFAPVRWDAGSTLFDSFELDSLLKTLDQATHPHTGNGEDGDDHHYDDDDAAETDSGALVLYQSSKPSHGVTQTRYQPEDEGDEENDHVFTPKKRALEKPVKEAVHHNMWKSFLHSLHLDGFQKLQSQVTPHDVHKKHGRAHKVHHSRDMDVAQQHDVQRGHHLWKLSFKAALKGHKQDQAALRSAWAAALKGNLGDEPVHHHHHHHYQHHHHHHDEGEDYEMTIQAISKRAARTSLDETRRRVSMDFERGGLEAPRNSLDIDERDRAAVQPKALSLWDVFEL